MRACLPLAAAVVVLLLAAPGVARARGAEDVFKGKVVILGKRPPLRMPSASAWIRFLQANKKAHIWPEKTNKKEWRFEFMAFFARPLNDIEVTVKFYDVTEGKKFVAGDTYYLEKRGQRAFPSNMVLTKPRFDVNRKYLMVVEGVRAKVTLASANFWLRGERERYSGKVTFTDDEARKKD